MDHLSGPRQATGWRTQDESLQTLEMDAKPGPQAADVNSRLQLDPFPVTTKIWMFLTVLKQDPELYNIIS